MKRNILALLAALLLPLTTACGLLLSGCDAGSPQEEISKAIGLDCRDAAVLTYSDDHGGFHGDGTTFAALQFPDPLDSVLAEDGAWRPLPLSRNLQLLIYGGVYHGPLADAEGDPLFPEIANGYWYFRDRHSESTDPQDDSQLLQRHSYNFTLAVYDADTKTLYYCKFDT